jgi:transposase
MRKAYPSDISREQFEHIRPLLESSRKHTRPRTLDLYEVFCGVLYVLKSGCQWRMLPSDFPKWQSVHAYFQIWNQPTDGKPSTLEQVLKKLVGGARQSNGRTETTSFLIIDAQSVKNTDTAKEKGYDAGKKVSGIKRHIAVDTNGLPHAIYA